MALALEPKTAAVRAQTHPLATRVSPQVGSPQPQVGSVQPSECAEHYPSTCLTPQDLRGAYFPEEKPEAPASEPQTVALVDAYNDANAAADLATYEREFGIDCSAPGCFEQVNQNGETGNLPFPKTKTELETFAKGTVRQRLEAEEAEGWSLEIATDIEATRAICNNCHILLIEADSPQYAGPTGLETAEDTAVALHATEISDSWGGPEAGTDTAAFNHPGIPIAAAAGDDGYLNWDEYEEKGSSYFEGADYPAASPHVISVGGTSLTVTAEGSWQSESAWNLGGGGCSTTLEAPEWQLLVSHWAQVGCGEHRASVDISADADPLTGVNIYDSTPYPEEEKGKKIRVVPNWVPVGGTSVASPIVASMSRWCSSIPRSRSASASPRAISISASPACRPASTISRRRASSS
jgi:subtilase family serine protease